ncbi:MAG: hypothetical protein K0M50_22495 [Prolixibacteraceae bacterium]|nr:hypothetical protein [Prolixibacteraceae bacterium]
MRSTVLKISVLFLLITLAETGCKKEEDLSFLDNSKEFYVSMSGFAIYKTKQDYFFNVPIRPYIDGYQCFELNEKSAQITLFKGKYYFNERYRLIDDYVVDSWAGSDYYFTSLSFDTYIREKLEPVVGATNPKMISSIIDRDPFTEFYYSDKRLNGKAGFTISELNQLIKDKSLEQYFRKMK